MSNNQPTTGQITTCPAAINIAGEHFWCDNDIGGGDHIGWAHSNRQAQAIWVGGDHDKKLHGPEWKQVVGGMPPQVTQ